jgi:hypothetical protein
MMSPAEWKSGNAFPRPRNRNRNLSRWPGTRQLREACATWSSSYHDGTACAELYNILAFHITLAPGAAPALVACVLWVLVFFQYRENFKGIFSAKPATQT